MPTTVGPANAEPLPAAELPSAQDSLPVSGGSIQAVPFTDTSVDDGLFSPLTFYEILGVPNDASDETLQLAVAQQCAIFSILINPETRAIYDAHRLTGLLQSGNLPPEDPRWPTFAELGGDVARVNYGVGQSDLVLHVDITSVFDRYLKALLQNPREDRTYRLIEFPGASLSQNSTTTHSLTGVIKFHNYVSNERGVQKGIFMAQWSYTFTNTLPLVKNGTFYLNMSSNEMGIQGYFNFSREFYHGIRLFAGVEKVPTGFRPSFCTQFSPVPYLSVDLQYKLYHDYGVAAKMVWQSKDGRHFFQVDANLTTMSPPTLVLRVESVVRWRWWTLSFESFAANRPNGTFASVSRANPTSVEIDNYLSSLTAQPGRIFCSLQWNTSIWPELHVGALCNPSPNATFSSEITVNLFGSVGLICVLRYGGYVFSLPIQLSNSWSPAAFGFGVAAPSLTFSLIRRLLYHPWLRGEYRRVEEMRRRLRQKELQKIKSRALLMQYICQSTATYFVQRELEENGLVIISARYGQFTQSPNELIVQLDALDVQSIDVTVPVQMMVENHRVHLPPGRWAELNGFYDPLAEVEDPTSPPSNPVRLLFVTYTYQGQLYTTFAEESRAKRMSRICRWRYAPGCGNAPPGSIAASDTCLEDFICTCVKLGNCLSACTIEECFDSCQAWSHWSATCSFTFHGNPVQRNRSRICKCDLHGSDYSQINVNNTCWQYSTCETRWELYRLAVVLFACVVIVNLATFVGSVLVTFLATSTTAQKVPGFNLNPIDTEIGLAEDISMTDDDDGVVDKLTE